MKLVISALNRQIKIEGAKHEKRERMLATANQVLYLEPLPESNPEYIEQLKNSVKILTFLKINKLNTIEEVLITFADWFNNNCDGCITGDDIKAWMNSINND